MNSKLKPLKFTPFSLREIKPTGWLKKQLEIQAEGLSGHLDEFWFDIAESGWIGGAGDASERMPYWLDGFIPMAFLLEREDLIIRARGYIDEIIKRQQDSGWITPTPYEVATSDFDAWSTFLILKVLVLWHDATGDERVEQVVYKSLQSLDRLIDGYTLTGWAATRWYECLISIYWLYERTGEEWLLDLALKLNCQGFDWVTMFKNFPMKKAVDRGRWSQMFHVVNNSMMLKSPALWWRYMGDDQHLAATHSIIDQLDEYHGMVTGMFTGDECLAGNSPAQGSELCSVAEYMYSLQHIISVTGDPKWSDRLERITYNALPATFSPDMWSHQYDQQVNQMECSRNVSTFLTNTSESNLFGLEPNYGCCTSNLSQAWPKFVQSTCMKTEKGFAVTAWAPVKVNTTINGVTATLEIITDYPFRNTAQVVVTTDHPTSLELQLRIPQWTNNAVIKGNGIELNPDANSYCTINIQGSTTLTVEFPMKPEIVARPNNLYAVTRGPLVYSLAIGERWEQINKDVPGREFPHCDYEIFATTPWNYGLCLDEKNVADLVFEEVELKEMPFAPQNAPIICKTSGRKVTWELEYGCASPTPSADVIGECEEITLIPYGCTNLRMTEMPLVKKD